MKLIFLCQQKSELFLDFYLVRYRSIDGSCNNLKVWWLGKARTPNKRYFENAYDNHLDEIRSMGSKGKALPNPRFISRLLFNENNQQDQKVTHLIAFFGQFLAHDITSVPSIC